MERRRCLRLISIAFRAISAPRTLLRHNSPGAESCWHAPGTHTRNVVLAAFRLKNGTDLGSPRGIDAAILLCVACGKSERNNRPLTLDKVKQNLVLRGGLPADSEAKN